MTRLVVFVLIGCLAAIAYGQTEKYVPPENTTTTQPPKPTDPPTPKPTDPPTPKPTAPTTQPTEPTTPASSTHVPTKPTPTPSTTSPITTTTKTTTPATKPTQPTIPPSPKPTPPPQPPKPETPSVGIWQLNYTKSNVSCVLVEFALQIEVPYEANNQTLTTYVNVPSDATVNGKCSKDDKQSVDLTWYNTDNNTDMLSLSFEKNATTKLYRLVEIKASLTPDNKYFPGFNGTTPLNLLHAHDEFKTTLSKSYKCAKKQELNLTDADSNKPRGSINVNSLQFEVFQNSTNKQFTDIEDCAPADTPDVVPIAVGCALAALVIIVLIAYLIGRRRGQARGYLSM